MVLGWGLGARAGDGEALRRMEGRRVEVRDLGGSCFGWGSSWERRGGFSRSETSELGVGVEGKVLEDCLGRCWSGDGGEARRCWDRWGEAWRAFLEERSVARTKGLSWLVGSVGRWRGIGGRDG